MSKHPSKKVSYAELLQYKLTREYHSLCWACMTFPGLTLLVFHLSHLTSSSITQFFQTKEVSYLMLYLRHPHILSFHFSIQIVPHWVLIPPGVSSKDHTTASWQCWSSLACSQHLWRCLSSISITMGWSEQMRDSNPLPYTTPPPPWKVNPRSLCSTSVCCRHGNAKQNPYFLCHHLRSWHSHERRL